MNTKHKNSKRFVLNNNFIEKLILVIYGLITVLTPSLQAFDSNGTKFLTLSVFNIMVLGYFLCYKKYLNKLLLFFKNRIGVAYALLILLSLLSFVKAINLSESILHFSKIITVFVATWFISVIVTLNKKVLYVVSLVFTGLLLFDSLSVYNGMYQFINQKIAHLDLIKTIYSNRNILVSSLFLKIPFALVLVYFYKGWVKVFGGIAFVMSILAILFLSSRAFYLAIIALIVLLFIFSILYKSPLRNKVFFKTTGFVVVGIVGLGLVFTVIQSNLYPKTEQDERGIISRISSITNTSDESNNLRLQSWKNSFELIKREPLLGVGLGNWKVKVLEYENKITPTYAYMYKAHNDFIEITAESGIIAGVSYLAIFIFVFLFFVKELLTNSGDENFKWYFLFFFGIVGYFFDAFFNFPQDRPQIQMLFAVFIGGIIGIVNIKKEVLNE